MKFINLTIMYKNIYRIIYLCCLPSFIVVGQTNNVKEKTIKIHYPVRWSFDQETSELLAQKKMITFLEIDDVIISNAKLDTMSEDSSLFKSMITADLHILSDPYTSSTHLAIVQAWYNITTPSIESLVTGFVKSNASDYPSYQQYITYGLSVYASYQKAIKMKENLIEIHKSYGDAFQALVAKLMAELDDAFTDAINQIHTFDLRTQNSLAPTSGLLDISPEIKNMFPKEVLTPSMKNTADLPSQEMPSSKNEILNTPRNSRVDITTHNEVNTKQTVFSNTTNKEKIKTNEHITSYQILKDTSNKISLNEIDVKLIYVSPGSFKMGVDEWITKSGKQIISDYSPGKLTKINSEFWIGQTEISQKTYELVMGNNPSEIKGEDYPVINVTWKNAINFCKKVNDFYKDDTSLPEGYVFRLPSHAEWELAARGGEDHPLELYSGSSFDPNLSGWHVYNSGGHLQKVGLKKPNILGIYDMSGNVWEWCADILPWKKGGPKVNIIKGGSYAMGRDFTRISVYLRVEENEKGSNSKGFRIVLAPANFN
jgi:formylglycine-generating enzyme required for sulfatase activity